MTDGKTKVKNMNSASERELEKVGKQLDEFESSVKEMTMDRLNAAPKDDNEPKVKLSQKEIAKKGETYLKPKNIISCAERFNEKFRDEYDFSKQFVKFIAFNNELGGMIEIWTKPYAGVPAQYWEIPCNVPVWGPRYLAEQIKRKFYHRLVMKDTVATEVTGAGTMFGQMAADTTIQRLDAQPVTDRKSIFMGAEGF